MRTLTASNGSTWFPCSRIYLSNRGHMSMHVPTIVIASSSRLGTLGSSIVPSAIALWRSASRSALSYAESDAQHAVKQ
jgi:hypothetical protein